MVLQTGWPARMGQSRMAPVRLVSPRMGQSRMASARLVSPRMELGRLVPSLTASAWMPSAWKVPRPGPGSLSRPVMPPAAARAPRWPSGWRPVGWR
jgi:hypothetical protein